ncbi:aldo/keto reductase [Actinacidiphila sp. DG2A-62]|jgi:aryl-alcohol dehydrogenase-like predicted oxidoreductase|uniref:aldo/keto reductase n=1 Tax=Actinacidiphila sp. DG2A-62 TaxID=3108821 RepID=UPI002DBD8525|nr:aldo/keto reductase [Actinacidiphila sp. DG2A-62]MEC3995516.1 aldo/keto reductase [Actinacidiphila sp. DG2A-62]
MARIGTSSLDVFPLSLGGNVFGWTADEDQSFAVLDAFTAAGGDFIDTADAYSAWVEGNSGGESETVIGHWLAKRGRRDDVVIATKVGSHPQLRGLRADTIRRGADASLARLGTDHIDVYYTHRDDPDTPVEEIVTALDALVKAGKVRVLGASNISPERLAASLDFAEREGLARYEIVQPHYNLVEREAYEGAAADLVAARGLSAAPYAGLAAGFLTGKYRVGTQVASARAAGASRYVGTERGERVLSALDEVAGARGVEAGSVALAWLLAQRTVVAPIASARTPEQLPALLAGVQLTLTPEELSLLDHASR